MCRSDSDGIGIGQRKNQRRQAELANHGISGPFFESGLRQKITQFKLTSFAPRVLPRRVLPHTDVCLLHPKGAVIHFTWNGAE
jgi:hypothetical protein